MPHTQLGTRDGRRGRYRQGREFGENGEHVRDIDFTDHDFTDHGRGHPNPHQHPIIPNPSVAEERQGEVGGKN